MISTHPKHLPKHFLVPALLALIWALAAPVQAIELGPMEVKSRVGQPLEAVIPISVESRRTQARDIQSNFFDYRRDTKAIKASQILALAPVKASIRKVGTRKFELLLTTNTPVREVRIAFGIKSNDGRGRTDSRRYIAIVPGSYEPKTDGAKSTFLNNRGIRRLDGNTNFVHGAANPGDVVSSSDYDSLWDLALQVKAGYGVSVYQTMIAIFNSNRHAFKEQNINNLMKGFEIAVPRLRNIDNFDRSTAIRAVAQMNYIASIGPVWERPIRDLLDLAAPDPSVVSNRDKPSVEDTMADVSYIPWTDEPVEIAPETNYGAGSVASAPSSDSTDSGFGNDSTPEPAVDVGIAPTEAPSAGASASVGGVSSSAPADLGAPRSQSEAAAEESNMGLIIIGIIIALLAVVGFVVMSRKKGDDIAALDGEGQAFADEQLDLVEAHIRMGRVDTAVEQLEAVLERADLTAEERKRAEDLRSQQQKDS